MDEQRATPAAESAEEYNYAVFEGQEPFDVLLATPHAGEQAPNATLLELDGGEVRLADLWRTHHLVIEFGSYT
jgi:hypothetical protein